MVLATPSPPQRHEKVRLNDLSPGRSVSPIDIRRRQPTPSRSRDAEGLCRAQQPIKRLRIAGGSLRQGLDAQVRLVEQLGNPQFADRPHHLGGPRRVDQGHHAAGGVFWRSFGIGAFNTGGSGSVPGTAGGSSARSVCGASRRVTTSASSIQPKRSGNSGRYFMVLNCDSEKGLTSET